MKSQKDYEVQAINDLEKRKDKTVVRTDTDNVWTKIESLQWVLFVIFVIRSSKMVVTYVVILFYCAFGQVLQF